MHVQVNLPRFEWTAPLISLLGVQFWLLKCLNLVTTRIPWAAYQPVSRCLDLYQFSPCCCSNPMISPGELSTHQCQMWLSIQVWENPFLIPKFILGKCIPHWYHLFFEPPESSTYFVGFSPAISGGCYTQHLVMAFTLRRRSPRWCRGKKRAASSSTSAHHRPSSCRRNPRNGWHSSLSRLTARAAAILAASPKNSSCDVLCLGEDLRISRS